MVDGPGWGSGAGGTYLFGDFRRGLSPRHARLHCQVHPTTLLCDGLECADLRACIPGPSGDLPHRLDPRTRGMSPAGDKTLGISLGQALWPDAGGYGTAETRGRRVVSGVGSDPWPWRSNVGTVDNNRRLSSFQSLHYPIDYYFPGGIPPR